MIKFAKAGKAYVATIAPGSRMWIKRNVSHTWDLIHESIKPGGFRTWTFHGKHATYAAAVAAANTEGETS